jgi:hypothetical protein
LFVGIKLGHESAIGVGEYYYPHGNDYADHPAEQDPGERLDAQQLTGTDGLP